MWSSHSTKCCSINKMSQGGRSDQISSFHHAYPFCFTFGMYQCSVRYSDTHISKAVRHVTRTRKILGSNLVQKAGYIWNFPQFLQVIAVVMALKRATTVFSPILSCSLINRCYMTSAVETVFLKCSCTGSFFVVRNISVVSCMGPYACLFSNICWANF